MFRLAARSLSSAPSRSLLRSSAVRFASSATPALEANRSHLIATHPDFPPPPDVVTFLQEQSEGLLSTYNRPPLVFVQGKGSFIYDTQDREYLDFSAGIAVNALGHADPEIAQLLSLLPAPILPSHPIPSRPFLLFSPSFPLSSLSSLMSSAGLSRRRGAPPPSSSNDEDDTLPSSSSSTTAPVSPALNSNRLPTNGAQQGGGGGALEGRGKIAFDPRDFQDGGESKQVPKLTLLEEVLLLGLKDNQGYTSWFNDNISYALRGCILIELALRRRIAVVKDPSRRRLALGDRLIEVIDDRQTGETILDETLKMMKGSEKYGTAAWVDLLSGETWNVMKIGYQLKQVRERLAKGLVDKGVLRTEKRNFLLFDMATHPVADPKAKEDIMRRTVNFLTTKTSAIPNDARLPSEIRYRTTRAVALCCAAYAANVLENALVRLEYDAREAAFARCDDILAEFCTWPFGAMGVTGGGGASSTNASSSGGGGGGVPIGGVAGGGVGAGRKRQGGGASSGMANQKEIMTEMVREVKKEMMGGSPAVEGPGGGEGALQEDLCFEVVATVLEVFSRMDSLL